MKTNINILFFDEITSVVTEDHFIVGQLVFWMYQAQC